jgi:hypothetical protein
VNAIAAGTLLEEVRGRTISHTNFPFKVGSFDEGIA